MDYQERIYKETISNIFQQSRKKYHGENQKSSSEQKWLEDLVWVYFDIRKKQEKNRTKKIFLGATVKVL